MGLVGVAPGGTDGSTHSIAGVVSTVSVETPCVGVKSEPTTKRRLRIICPGEADARLPGVEGIGLKGGATVGVSRTEPIGAQCAISWVPYGWIEAGHVVLNFVPAMVDLVAKTKVDG